MKPLLIIITCLGLLAGASASAQGFGESKRILAPDADTNSSELTRFDLDFPGGTPNELVQAISKAMGHPLNAIVGPDFSAVKIPPLKMRSVNVAELFEALSLASNRLITYSTGAAFGGGTREVIQQASTNFGFRTQGHPSDNSVWYFFYSKPALPQDGKACRFWQLAPYLTSYQIEDITTAIQTGYKLLDESEPTLSFHKETKLLIAVGEPGKLKLIDSVLDQLVPGRPAPPRDPPPPTEAPEPRKK